MAPAEAGAAALRGAVRGRGPTSSLEQEKVDLKPLGQGVILGRGAQLVLLPLLQLTTISVLMEPCTRSA